MDHLVKYNQWIDNKYFDEETRNELLSLKGDEKEIEDRFYKDLEFGTGGLRGILGAGSNRLNIYTVRKATQGLANSIIKAGGQDKGVAIAYDSRRMSTQFAKETALCLNANGIKAYVFESLRPTPELSFSIRELGCIAGVVITASHNPPQYNGYKVYWEDGAQVTPPRDQEIIDEVNRITDYSQVRTMELAKAKEKGLYISIGKEIDDRYIEELKKIVINQIPEECKDLKIVYTPLHGTGGMLAKRILKEIGFKNVYLVAEQFEGDSNFPTVSYPNPEDPKVFELALKLANEVKADLILATDPDADRLGMQVRNKEGDYVLFTGNMVGSLLTEYILSQRSENGILPNNGALVKTIVSTNMVDEIAKEYGVTLFEVLTGFKYIGEKIKEFKEDDSYKYLFGFEESYGYLSGTYTRDKDGIASVMLLCEAAAYYKKRGLTLYEQMESIYKKYGYYHEYNSSITHEGVEGMLAMENMMKNYRTNPPTTIGSYKVLKCRDYLKGEITDIKTGRIEPTGLPESNVLYYELEEDAWCAVRPSGTEPKVKYYFGVKGSSEEDAKKRIEELIKDPIFLA